MRNDRLEHIFRESLEQHKPEVPDHLWENIRTSIPKSPPQPSSSGAGNAAGSASAGSSAMLKIGIAAVALIGVGALVWQLTTSDPQKSPVVEQQTEHVESTVTKNQQEQISVVAPEIPAETEEVIETEADESQTAEKTASTVDNGASEDVESPSTSTPIADIESSGDDESADEYTIAAEDPIDDEVEGPTLSQEEDGNPVVDDGDDESIQENDPIITDQSTEDVVPDPAPLIMVEAGILANKVSGEAPMSVQFSNVSPAKSYEWDFGNGRKSYEPTPMTTFDKEGEYTVSLIVTDFEDNQLRDQMQVSVFAPSTFFVPNAFSPNGDGANDFFRVEGTNVTEVKFTIFRLDGSVVFEGFGLDAKWDGVDEQNPLADKYHVVATAIKTNGEPIQKRVVLTILRD